MHVGCAPDSVPNPEFDRSFTAYAPTVLYQLSTNFPELMVTKYSTFVAYSSPCVRIYQG